MSKVDKKQLRYREACERLTDMEVESMSVQELKQYVYEDLVQAMHNCNDMFDYYAKKWEWTEDE